VSANVYIKSFEADLELSHLNKWLALRQLSDAQDHETAGVGYIAYQERKEEEDLPLAVLFLKRCEGNFGIIDGLCSNPDAPGSLRHVAIDKLIEACCKKAKSYGMRFVLSWSVDSGTLLRTRGHGFAASDQTFIVKDLSFS
jgi:hypothetical protein